MRRLAAGVIWAGLTVLALPGEASAETMRASGAAAGDCAESFGGDGTDAATYVAPGRGFVTARLRGGPRGDWELAAFRRGEGVGASTAIGSNERIDLYAKRGQRFLIQACRTDGGPKAVRLDISFAAYTPEPAEPVSLARVPIAGPDDLAELERMGVDITHDVGPDSATVVLYSREERLQLNKRGFGVEMVVPDLAAADAADRAAESRVPVRGTPSGLPSGRTSYRQYTDYTNDLDELAADHPGLVREVEIGKTVENRPIQGVEIAADVDATDDGRPVYVQLGAHHAREWPSAELPMEFAIDLAENYGTDPRITALLDEVRVLIVPVVNVDGFLVSRGLTGEYRRKNCRGATVVEQELACAMHLPTSGVDLNRNYGAYWGGPGSSSSLTNDAYRGPAPYSEPESQAVREYTAGLHPTVFISNHTYTTDGKWLRQPGFDGAFFPQDSIGATTPDEAAMKGLGDAMEGATGWTSERSYETLGDITGATEDWNYLSQGSYGYTPEARGTNFHANYQDSVVGEYLGEGPNAGEGLRDAYLIAGEIAADRDHHSVIEGTAPEAATLRLRKEFKTALHPNQGQNAHIDDVLDTTLEVPDGGDYEWDVMPSGRPLHQGETWTMSCELPSEDPVSQQVFVARGEIATVDWSAGCAAGGGPNPIKCRGTVATLIGSKGNDRAASKLIGTPGVDVIAARGGNDIVRADAGKDIVCGGSGDDELDGGPGEDVLRGGPGKDRCPGANAAEAVSCRPS